MSSVGIPEGTVIPGDPCTCQWMVLTSLPPKYVLQKKCQHCIEQEVTENVSENTQRLNSLVSVIADSLKGKHH